jgi:hypothetical protein
MQFAARTSGPLNGLLTVDYSSDKPRNSQVVLDASGGRPQLALAPVSFDFGELPVGGKEGKTLRLTNAGTKGPLHFRGVRATGDVMEFDISTPKQGAGPEAWSGGAWPTLTAADIPIAPGADYLDLRLYFQPLSVGSFQATLYVQTDDLFNPERAVTLVGRARTSGPCTFRVDPQPVMEFGNVPVGHGAVLGFRFEDTGTTECAVKDIHLANTAGGAFFMPGGPIVGGVLEPTDAFSAQVAFKAQSNGDYNGELDITVNSPSVPIFRLPLHALAATTCLSAAPPYIDFGAIREDCSPKPGRTFISNICTNPVTVDSVAIGPGTANEFSLTAVPPLPVTLPPFNGFEVDAQFARKLLGQQYNPLWVTAQGEPPLLVPLLGETNHDGHVLDTFLQGTDNQLDVLFVISNTTTMDGFQDRLAGSVPGWLGTAQTDGVDLRVGVTTTGLVPHGTCPGGVNGGEAGRLFPVDYSNPRVVGGADPNAANLISSNLHVGDCHYLPQGLEAMRQALTPPLSSSADDPRTPQPNDGNLGFVRPTARLAVVLLADEDDRSGFDPESYAQLLEALKGQGMGYRVSFSAIVPTDTACSTAGPPGPRYAAVATGTGGQVFSICRGSYGSLLESLLNRAAAPQLDFPLSAKPDLTQRMLVAINSVTVAGTLWGYYAPTNSVVFDPSSRPVPGDTITVDYQARCGP